MKRRRVLGLAVLFATSFGVGVMTTLAGHALPANCILPDASIAWYNGGTGEYAGIYHGEAISDSNSWHNASVIDFTQVGSPGTSDIINSYNGDYGFTMWSGRAVYKPDNSCLGGSAQVEYWNTQLNQYWLDDGTYTLTAKQHVACQELGHGLGLHHDYAPDTCMDDSNPPFHTKPQPGAHDIDQLAALYPAPPPPPSPTPTPPPCGHDLQCYPSLRQCQAECCGVCERRINCGSETAHKCFEN